MGTTRIKVIDLSREQKEIKTSRKRAEKLSQVDRLNKANKTVEANKKPAIENNNIAESESEKGQHLAPTDSILEPAKITKLLEPSFASDQHQPPTPKPAASTTRRKPLHHTGKKYQNAKKLIEDKIYSVKEAFELLPKTSITHFDPAVEIHLNVVDKNIKGSITYPHQTVSKKKETKYLVFTDKPSETIAAEGKQIIWGDEKTIADIEIGKLKPSKNFDIVIASVKFMPQLAKIAKILGPRGLMPNPKNGTVTEDIGKALLSDSEGRYNFKTDPNAPVIHAKIGKLSQGVDKLWENLKTLIFAIGPSKIRKAVITSSMGPAIKLDLQTI